jgi:hypothetical protein
LITGGLFTQKISVYERFTRLISMYNHKMLFAKLIYSYTNPRSLYYTYGNDIHMSNRDIIANYWTSHDNIMEDNKKYIKNNDHYHYLYVNYMIITIYNNLRILKSFDTFHFIIYNK